MPAFPQHIDVRHELVVGPVVGQVLRGLGIPFVADPQLDVGIRPAAEPGDGVADVPLAADHVKVQAEFWGFWGPIGNDICL